jgi:YidC/Oxa1 family membrane protein insertase
MDRTTVITVGLCVILLVVWFVKFGSPAPQDPTPQPPDTEQAPATEPPADLPTKPEETTEPTAGSAPQMAVADAKPEETIPPAGRTSSAVPANDNLTYPLPATARPTAEDLRFLPQKDYATIAVDVDGGGITRVELTQHLDDQRRDPMRLGSFKTPFMRLVSTGDKWTGEREVLDGTEHRTIAIERISTSGLVVRETWRALEDAPYRFSHRIEFVNPEQRPRTVKGFAVGAGGILPDNASAGPKMGRVGMMMLGVDIAPAGTETTVSLNAKKIDSLKPEQISELANVDADWIAIHNKYFIFFLSALDLENGTGLPFAGVSVGMIEPTADDDTEEAASRLYGLAMLPEFVLEPGGSRVFELTGYVGPKEYRLIRLLGKRADSVLGMDFFFFGRARWMGSLSRLVLRSLLKLHDWGLSYGLAIILITLFVKGIFWPLTHKSTMSMRKMQKIQPLVKEIRDKHKSEPTVMNQKIMALYKEHKVNPLGGCLPVLCQIPVFLALFNTFRGAIELRHTAFLWVADLSQPDTLPFGIFGLPIRPLPIVMGACMLLQHHLGPSTDPNQKRMMMFMTLFFMFIFYSMPAGLTLYWTVNQLLTMVQHLMLRRADNSESTAGAAA